MKTRTHEQALTLHTLGQLGYFLLSLKPSHVYARLDEFDGYLASLFPGVAGAVLENPFEGNAVYYFNSHWRELPRLSKTELFQQAKHQDCRIVHSGDWQKRVKHILSDR